jgi:hypothetical protein
VTLCLGACRSLCRHNIAMCMKELFRPYVYKEPLVCIWQVQKWLVWRWERTIAVSSLTTLTGQSVSLESRLEMLQAKPVSSPVESNSKSWSTRSIGLRCEISLVWWMVRRFHCTFVVRVKLVIPIKVEVLIVKCVKESNGSEKLWTLPEGSSLPPKVYRECIIVPDHS